MSLGALGRALNEHQFRTGFALMALGSLLFGILGVLAPLHLGHAGWGAAGIGAVWLVGAGLETAEAPIVGRMSDRRGPLVPTRVALTGAVAVMVGLSVGARPLFYVPLIPLAAISIAPLFITAFALFANGAESVGLAQGMGFGVMNAAWALGAIAGPAAGGAIAGATGDWIPFVIGASLCALALVILRPRALVPVTETG
jgi:MFS family permease